MDLEWNQSPYGKGSSKKEMPFEILEIGAVKLNEEGQEIGRFSELIRPQVYRRLHPIMEGMLHMTMEELLVADIFQNVASRFLDWCGPGPYRFATWGTMDLTELQRNFRYFHVEADFEKPLYFYDVQKTYAYWTKSNAKSLEAATDELSIIKDEPFHQALSDAVYTARILNVLPVEILKEQISIDYFQSPKTRKEEIWIQYPDSSLFVSRENDTKEEVMENKLLRCLPCVYCNKRLNKKIHWFSDGSNHFYCLGFCQKDGAMIGKINLKKNIEGKVFAVRTIVPADQERVDRLKEKRKSLQKKRQSKRK